MAQRKNEVTLLLSNQLYPFVFVIRSKWQVSKFYTDVLNLFVDLGGEILAVGFNFQLTQACLIALNWRSIKAGLLGSNIRYRFKHQVHLRTRNADRYAQAVDCP